VSGYEAKIVDDDMNELPDGTVGKLAVRGPTGCRYLGDSRQSSYVRDGWNLTGDSFVRDAQGRLSFVARSDDMIVASGYNIAGPEIEAALLTHPAVAECGVVGAPDEARGMIVKAYIVVASGIESDAALATALQEHVKRQIAPYKYPRAIEFVAQLPKTETGKLKRAALREMAQANAASARMAAK
jgi:2-aminobenzoate-CoA ligase